MKRTILLSTSILLYLSACGSPQSAPTARPTPIHTLVPTSTQTTTPMATHTPEPTMTPWPIPSNVTFCLDKVESGSDKLVIQEAIRKAHQYFVQQLGVEPMPVILFAGPDVNKFAGDGECADNPQLQRARRDSKDDWVDTGGYALFGLLVINTNFSGWMEDREFRKFTIAHEYVHELQMSLLGRGINGTDAGPTWLVEGSAEVIAYSSQGLEPNNPRIYWVQNRYKIPASVKLGDEGNNFNELSSLAVSYLITIVPDRMRSLVTYFAANPTADTWQLAFEKAFGLSPEEFNDKFEAFR